MDKEDTIIQINNIVRSTFKEQKHKLIEDITLEVKANLREEILRFIEGVGREVIIDELKNIDVPQELANRLDSLMRDKFKPIIVEAYHYVNQKHRKKILDYLNKLTNLKTSTLEGVKEEVKRTPITEAPEIADHILKEFPEYKEAIKQIR